jgi:hypothetical protein
MKGLPTKEQLAAFRKKKQAGMTGKKTLEERKEQIAKPEIQKIRNNAQLAAEIASYAIPGFGMAKTTAKLATLAPKAIKNLRAAIGKDNRDAIRLALGLDKKVGGAKSNLVSPRIKKGPDGKPLGSRPVGKGVVKKAKNIRRGAAATAAVAATAAALKNGEKKKPESAKTLPEREVGYAPKVNALEPADPTPAPKNTGSEYKAYPGAAGRAGFEYGRDITEVLDDKTVSQEIKERLEEEELYEGDFKGGRVGKSKKKKVSKAPRGVRAAMRGYKTMKIGGKVGKRTRGTGGSWV